MLLGRTEGSRALFASLLCVTMLGCATDDPDPSYGGQQPGPGSQVQNDGGAPIVTGTGGPGALPGTTGGLPGTAGGAQPGGGVVQPGGGVQPGGVVQPGGGAQPGGIATPGGGQPGAPPDLGMNSQGDTFFRAYTMTILKPKIWTTVFLLGATDVTAQVQGIVDAAISTDADANGRVDASLLVRFLQTQDPAATNGQVTVGGGRCPLPLARENACGPEPVFAFQSPAVAYSNSPSCPLDGTTEVAAGPCFATARTSLAINVPLLGPIPLQDGQVIGTWQNGEIIEGRVRGFLPRAVATATKLPMDIPLEYQFGGVEPNSPLANYLNTVSDTMGGELSKNSQGEEGWWFLIKFTAKPATFNPALPTM